VNAFSNSLIACDAANYSVANFSSFGGLILQFPRSATGTFNRVLKLNSPTFCNDCHYYLFTHRAYLRRDGQAELAWMAGWFCYAVCSQPQREGRPETLWGFLATDTLSRSRHGGEAPAHAPQRSDPPSHYIFKEVGRQRLKLFVADSRSLTATGRHLPYEITQCYLPPDTSERAPPYTPTSKVVLDLFILEGLKAELTQATRQCTSRELNSRSLDHKSNHYTTEPPGVHHVTICRHKVINLSKSLN